MFNKLFKTSNSIAFLRKFFIREGKLEERYLGDMDAVHDWAAFYKRHKRNIDLVLTVAEYEGKEPLTELLKVFKMSVDRIHSEERKSKLPKARQEFIDARLGTLKP